jgi:hypothetical protein
MGSVFRDVLGNFNHREGNEMEQIPGEEGEIAGKVHPSSNH